MVAHSEASVSVLPTNSETSTTKSNTERLAALYSLLVFLPDPAELLLDLGHVAPSLLNSRRAVPLVLPPVDVGLRRGAFRTYFLPRPLPAIYLINFSCLSVPLLPDPLYFRYLFHTIVISAWARLTSIGAPSRHVRSIERVWGLIRRTNIARYEMSQDAPGRLHHSRASPLR